MAKKAVILMNLGGPDSLQAVQPFLFNLFYDKAILNIPNPFRFILAQFISRRREGYAKKIYEKIGGSSPILKHTIEQAKALEGILNKGGEHEFKVFISMRYWKPFAHETIKEVQAFCPDEVILLPLYPQFSTTTTASSIADWKVLAERFGLFAKHKSVCCYPAKEGFILAYADLILKKHQEALQFGNPVVLFSAHGIPMNRIKRGDPYEWQVLQTVKSVVQKLGIQNLEYKLCYQSKVGPLKWLGPSIHDEILSACTQKKPIIVVPISFVSEHSETLVELDITYNEIAIQNGCPAYFRVEAVGAHKLFIEGLKELCFAHQSRICPTSFQCCFTEC